MLAQEERPQHCPNPKIKCRCRSQELGWGHLGRPDENSFEEIEELEEKEVQPFIKTVRHTGPRSVNP